MPKSLAQWDKDVLWHPFTQQSEWASRDPLIIESAKGVWIKDIHGKQYIDGVSSLWVNVFGHNHPILNRAIEQQLKKMAHTTFLGLTHAPAIELAKKLLDIAPSGLSRVFYSDNGSTAVEVAMKIAYQYWQLRKGCSQPPSPMRCTGEGWGEGKLVENRPSSLPSPIRWTGEGIKGKTKFLSMKNGYHGDTLGVVSVGGVDLFHQRFHHLLFSGFHVTPGNFKEIERVIQIHHREIAAVVMEPLIQGASGMLVMPKGYLAHVARLCRKFDVLLIIDEVATGFGRTGKMFAVEHENVQPDFLCVAKSLTGGYLPLAATLTTKRVYQAFLGRFDEFKAFFHGHTYTANPLACAVAIATLDLYKKNRLLSQVRQRIIQMKKALNPLRSHPHVKEIRQVGMMVGIELVQDKKTGKSYPPGFRMGLKVCDEALKYGVWLRPLGDVIVLMPPLSISKRELDLLCDALIRSLEVFNVQEISSK